MLPPLPTLLLPVTSLTQMLGSSGQQRMVTWDMKLLSSGEKDYVFRAWY